MEEASEGTLFFFLFFFCQNSEKEKYPKPLFLFFSSLNLLSAACGKHSTAFQL